jgi:hypothetical protein
MIRIALSLLAISLLGACSYNRSTTVETQPTAPGPAAVAAPPGSTVITTSPSSTTYSTATPTGVQSTTVVR